MSTCTIHIAAIVFTPSLLHYAYDLSHVSTYIIMYVTIPYSRKFLYGANFCTFHMSALYARMIVSLMIRSLIVS